MRWLTQPKPGSCRGKSDGKKHGDVTAPGLADRMSSAPVTASARMKPIMSVLMTAEAWRGASTNIQNTNNSVSKVSNGSRS